MADEDDVADFIRAEDLRTLAAKLGYSAETVRSWRRRGLLPHGVQRGGHWWYPPETGEQLRALCELRLRGVELDDLAVLLFIDGFTVDEVALRKALRRTAAWWTEAGATVAAADEAEVDQTAAKLAAQRTRSALPRELRRLRMPLSEKERAIGFALHSLAGTVSQAAGHLDAAAALDRLLGLDRRRAGVRGLLLAEDPTSLARMFAADRLTAGLGATTKERELARRVLAIVRRYGDALLALAASDLGPVAVVWRQMLVTLPGDLLGRVVTVLLLALSGAFAAVRGQLDLDEALALSLDDYPYVMHESLESSREKRLFRGGLARADRTALETRLVGEGLLKKPRP